MTHPDRLAARCDLSHVDAGLMPQPLSKSREYVKSSMFLLLNMSLKISICVHPVCLQTVKTT